MIRGKITMKYRKKLHVSVRHQLRSWDIMESNHLGGKKFRSVTKAELSGRWSAAAAKSLQSCPTLCDPIDGSPPGFPIPGILQARTLEWVAISFSNAWRWKVKVKSLSCVWLLATPWTAAHQAPPSMGFSRQECWSGVPLPSPRIGTSKVNKEKTKVNREMVYVWNGVPFH